MRSFLLVKTKPGMEKEVQDRFRAMPEVREIHLITGKFDLLVALESEETDLDPRKKVVELVIEKVRKAGGIIDTRTILPIESELRPTKPSERPTAKGFAFIMSEAGKTQELIRKILQVPEVPASTCSLGKRTYSPKSKLKRA